MHTQLLYTCAAILLAYVVHNKGGEIWVRGNTHTHTSESDGDSKPEVVIEWYKSHGYNFLALSDHDRLTNPSRYADLESDDFILIPGDELSTTFEGHPVHVNGLGIKQGLKSVLGETLVGTIQKNVDLVNGAGGLCHINHPNFGWGFGHRELLKVTGFNLLEIYNGHPDVRNAGDMAHLPVEQVWDILLSSGRRIYGMAVDDAHDYTRFDASLANPGRGWIVVKVNSLSSDEILTNIRNGAFYASTGVELADYSVDDDAIRVSAKHSPNLSYVIRFIGLHGRILAETDGPLAIYKFAGGPDEAYVRAKVIASDGTVAWTQPVRRRH